EALTGRVVSARPLQGPWFVSDGWWQTVRGGQTQTASLFYAKTGSMQRQVYAGADRRWSASARRRLPVGSRGHGGHPRTLVRRLCRSLSLGGWLRRGQA